MDSSAQVDYIKLLEQDSENLNQTKKSTPKNRTSNF